MGKAVLVTVELLFAMTIEQAMKYLSVSRAHVDILLESGTLLEVLPRNPFGERDIDVASVQAYRTRIDAAVQAYLNSRTEDNEPPRV